MMHTEHAASVGVALRPEIVDAIEHAASAARDAKRAELIALAMLAAASTSLPPVVVDMPQAGIVDGVTLDRVLGISASTRHRLIREGLPFETVGGRKRFEIAVCRAWLNDRGQRPALVAPPRPDDGAEELSAERMQRAGLRRTR